MIQQEKSRESVSSQVLAWPWEVDVLTDDKGGLAHAPEGGDRYVGESACFDRAPPPGCCWGPVKGVVEVQTSEQTGGC